MNIHIDKLNPNKTKPIFDHSKIDGRKSLAYNFVDRTLTDSEYLAIEKLCLQMGSTMIQSDGIGLALPQIGIFNGRLFIIRDFTENMIQAFFNPTYSPDTIEKESQIEGCLSVRKTTSQLFSIERPISIKATWYHLEPTKNFSKREETLTGPRARIFMHEYDHLQGISIVNKYKKK